MSNSLSSPLLQFVANVFQVTVLGAPELTGFWIEPGARSTIARGFTYWPSETPAKRQKGYEHLFPRLRKLTPKPLDARWIDMCSPPD